MDEEFEILESIYEDDLVIERTAYGANIRVACKPLGDDHAFVRATVQLKLDEKYPAVPPIIDLPISYGLDDHERLNLQKVLETFTEVNFCAGEAFCFSIVELVKEKLDDLNRKAECQICLSALFQSPPKKLLGFLNGLPSTSPWASTPCRHQFHSACLAR